MPSSAMRRAAESARLQAAKASWLRCATKRQLRVKSSRLVRSMLHAIQATVVLLCARAGCSSQTYAVPRWRCASKRGTLKGFGVAGHCVHCSNSFRHRFARAVIRNFDKNLDDASSSRISQSTKGSGVLSGRWQLAQQMPTSHGGLPPHNTHTQAWKRLSPRQITVALPDLGCVVAASNHHNESGGPTRWPH